MEIVDISQFRNLNRHKASTGNYYHLYVVPKDDIKPIVPDIPRDRQWQQNYSSEQYDTCS